MIIFMDCGQMLSNKIMNLNWTYRKYHQIFHEQSITSTCLRSNDPFLNSGKSKNRNEDISSGKTTPTTPQQRDRQWGRKAHGC